jgi:hypothetical protein
LKVVFRESGDIIGAVRAVRDIGDIGDIGVVEG